MSNKCFWIGKDWILKILAKTSRIEGKISTTAGGRRKWAAVKAVMKEKKIAKLLNLLERTKSSLILGLQIDFRHVWILTLVILLADA